MIVISGALVAVALILLIVGLTVTTLNLIYASIAVSAVSLVCLLVGIFQRRGDLPAADTTVADPVVARAEGTSQSAAREAAVRKSRVAGAGSSNAPGQPAAAGTVLVVEGRPRYHVAGCRYLTGKQADEVTVDAAQTGGFTACGVCKPPVAVTSAGDLPVVDPLDVPFDLIASGPLHLDTTSDSVLPEPAVAAEEIAAPQAEVAAPKAAAKKVAAKQVAAPKVAAPKVATPVKAPVVVDPVTSRKLPAAAPAVTKVAAAVKAPARVPAKRAVKAPVTALAEVAPDLDRVVVIADRNKFHLSACRFVRGAADTSLITRDAAQTQGFVACGVCKP